MRKPTSYSAVPGSLPSESAHYATLLPFPLSFSSLPPFSSSLFFFHFLIFSSISPFLSSLSLLLSSLSLLPSPSFSLLVPRTEACCPLACLNSPCEAPYIGFKGAMHVDTWHAMCHTHGLPCFTHMVCHVSSTWLAMCRPTLVASKYMKFRLSQNSMKFGWVTRFCETVPTVQSVSPFEI